MGNSLGDLVWGPAHVSSKRIIQLPNGCRLRGKCFIFKEAEKQTEIDAFLNIPFGKAPIGELRFKVSENQKKSIPK